MGIAPGETSGYCVWHKEFTPIRWHEGVPYCEVCWRTWYVHPRKENDPRPMPDPHQGWAALKAKKGEGLSAHMAALARRKHEIARLSPDYRKKMREMARRPRKKKVEVAT